ncbi:MAG: 2-hydroxyacid dehydrogenase [Thermoplasmataceae archaeon]
MEVLIETDTGPRLHEHLKEISRNLGFELVYSDDIKDRSVFKVLIVGHMKLRHLPELVSEMPELRMIQTLSAGVDMIDFKSIPEQILLCSNAGAYSDPIAEHVFAMILDLSKNITKNYLKMREGVFDQKTVNRRVAGKKIGIIGYGGIGKAVAAIARKFDMKILAISRSGSREDEVFLGGIDDVDYVLSNSDIVVISLPLSNHTRGIINSAKLEKMKKDAILINVARAEIIDQKDLYDHLSRNRDFKAGIDVWWAEPLSKGKFEIDFPFLELENFIGSPHNSSLADGETVYAYEQALTNVSRFVHNQNVRNKVNRSDYS